MSKIKEFFKDLFAKCASLFAKCTSTKKGNILFMAVELVLVLAIAGGGIAGVAISALNSKGENVTSSTETYSSEVSSEEIIVSSSEGEEVTSEEETSSEDYVYSTSSAEPEYTYTTETVPTSTAPLTQWSEDVFLPALEEPASVLDYYDTSKLSNEETLMFTSLKGVVNKVQPRIYTCDSDPSASYNTWIEKLDIKLNKVTNPYTLIDKYKKELAGIVIYDDTDKLTIHTINLATTIAGTRSALVVSPALAKVIQKKYNFKVIEDLRKPLYKEDHSAFNDKWEIYEYMYDYYLDGTSDRIIVGLDPEGIYGYLRDYAIAIGANVIYLDPEANLDVDLLNKYYERMKPGKSFYMGWHIQENMGVKYAASYGIATIAADYNQNLSVYAGMQSGQKITARKTAKAPKLENKIYIAFIISDGDNLQYMEGFLQSLWAQETRGDFPITWTMTPTLYDIGKPLLNYYNKTASANDCFISGPSGFGYFYPGYWTRHDDIAETLPGFLQLTNKYFKKLGWRAITVWNDDYGELSKSLVKTYSENMPYLLGISQQSNQLKKQQYVYGKDFVVTGFGGADYCSELYQFQQKLTNTINAFYESGADAPVFLPLQAQNWSLGADLSNLATVKKSAEMTAGADVEFIRFDQMLQLMAEYYGK